MTEIFGTVASATAKRSFAPWRMIPCRSTWLPIMKPGTSARNSSGMLNALQSQTNLAPLSDESLKSTPPLAFGRWAPPPPPRRSSRASPVMSSGAKSRFVSKKLPSSTSRSITWYMSKTRFCSAGTISSMGRPAAGAAGAAAGGASRQLRGMYVRYRVTSRRASSSLAASTTPRPLTVQCMRAPPISSMVTFSPDPRQLDLVVEDAPGVVPGHEDVELLVQAAARGIDEVQHRKFGVPGDLLDALDLLDRR